MKVIAINSSPRKEGNTYFLLNMVLDEIKAAGIETEIYSMAGKQIQGCIACYQCMKNKNGKCVVDKDIANECIAKMREAEGILLGSPTYFSDVSAGMKALIERAGFVSRANDYFLKRKIGAGVVAVRRAGSIPAFNSLNLFFIYNQMILPGSSYWHMAMGRDPGDVKNDAEGVQTMKTLGQNMAWLMQRVNS
jgi:multimeric flavodoxin WrbA